MAGVSTLQWHVHTTLPLTSIREGEAGIAIGEAAVEVTVGVRAIAVLDEVNARPAEEAVCDLVPVTFKAGVGQG